MIGNPLFGLHRKDRDGLQMGRTKGTRIRPVGLRVLARADEGRVVEGAFQHELPHRLALSLIAG